MALINKIYFYTKESLNITKIVIITLILFWKITKYKNTKEHMTL